MIELGLPISITMNLNSGSLVYRNSLFAYARYGMYYSDFLLDSCNVESSSSSKASFFINWYMDVRSLGLFKYKALLIIDWAGLGLAAGLIMFSAVFGLMNAIEFFKEVLFGFFPFLIYVGIDSGTLHVIGCGLLSLIIWWIVSHLIVDRTLKSMEWSDCWERSELKNVLVFKSWNAYTIFGFSKWLIAALSVLVVAPLYWEVLYQSVFLVVVGISVMVAVGAIIAIYHDYARPYVSRVYYPETHHLYPIWISSEDGIWDSVSDQEMDNIPVSSPDYEIASYLTSKIRDKNRDVKCNIKYDFISMGTLDDFERQLEASPSYEEERLG
jgi:hypothetical protein